MNPGTLADIGRPVVGMNAYLGADAIMPALRRRAQMLWIGGRSGRTARLYLAPPRMRHTTAGKPELAKLGAGTPRLAI